jgi:2-amino-4-hydroxy-6-hydroxymethyldihydropteridine diphosphokinase
MRILRRSRVLETKPLGAMDQPDYLNCVVEIRTSLTPKQLVREFNAVEQSLGRIRVAKWSPRPVDIDLLLHGNSVIRSASLCVPHPQMHLRSFVMRGMAELAPSLVHPVLGETMKTLADRLGDSSFVLDASRPQLISIAGAIGVGKTTLAEALAARLRCRLLREAYDTNPFLARVYAGQKTLALDSQLHFLVSRVRQLGVGRLAAGKAAVSDYLFDQEKIFAGRWLSRTQMWLYAELNACASEKVWSPVVTIFLHDTARRCLARIRARGRIYEQSITLAFIEQLQRDYEKMFEGWSKSPLFRIDVGRTDCRNAEDVRRLAGQLRAYMAL